MDNIKILWADDEIELLKPQLMFLKRKGYEVTTVSNGYDAIDEFKDYGFDIVFLDESMPGITGLETLAEIKKIDSLIPVVMITNLHGFQSRPCRGDFVIIAAYLKMPREATRSLVESVFKTWE